MKLATFYLLFVGSLIAQEMQLVNSFRFAAPVGPYYVTNLYVITDSLAGTNAYDVSGLSTTTNWPHAVTTNLADAYVLVTVGVVGGTTNFIGPDTVVKWGSTALTLLSSNKHHISVQDAQGVFGAPLGNLGVGTYTVSVTNELAWSTFIGQSVVVYNAHQSTAPAGFNWGYDAGSPGTDLSVTNALQTNDLAAAWAFHVSSVLYDVNPIPNFWLLPDLAQSIPEHSLVTSNTLSYFGNWADTNRVTLARWNFASDFPSGTADVIGVGFRVVYRAYTDPIILVTSTTPGTDRNDYSGDVGGKFNANYAMTVTALGRWVVSGNSGTHTVKLVRSGSTLGSVSVDTSGATAGQYLYVNLGSPISIAADDTFYIMSTESSGGDHWFDLDTAITTRGEADSTGAAYDSPPTDIGSAGVSYVPVSFKFTVP